MLAAHLGKPLSSVPDPFSNEYPSFAAHNNARLRRFLDRFGFEYEFLSATECYKAGRFDATLSKMLEVYDEVMDIILPTLGPERRATYSPFLPICPAPARCCRCRCSSATRARAPSSTSTPTPAKGRDARHRRPRQGAVEGRLGAALDGAGRRLRDVRQGPDQLGDAVLQDLPRARRGAAGELHLRAVPRRGRRQDLQVQGQRPHRRRVADLRLAGEPVAVHVPEAEGGQAALLRRDPAHGRRVSAVSVGLSAAGRQRPARQRRSGTFTPARRRPQSCRSRSRLLLNLVAASNAHDKDVLWGFIRRRAPEASPEAHPLLDHLAGYAVRYYEDFVAPEKKFRLPDEVEADALRALSDALGKAPPDAGAEELQAILYDVGRRFHATRTRAPRVRRPTSPASPTPGSAPSIRCCWARRRAPASAASSSSTAWTTRAS